MLSDEEKKNIVEHLSAKLPAIKCPMCGNDKFVVADAYIRNELQKDFQNISLGGPSIPAVAIICGNCGFLSQHAAGVLGLLPKEKSESEIK